MTRNTRTEAPPFSLRLTLDERAKLERDAAGHRSNSVAFSLWSVSGKSARTWRGNRQIRNALLQRQRGDWLMGRPAKLTGV